LFFDKIMLALGNVRSLTPLYSYRRRNRSVFRISVKRH
jgi:hypothetical protein